MNKKIKCRNCGQLDATETWKVCSVCGDILQDYLIDTYKFNRKVIGIIKYIITNRQPNSDARIEAELYKFEVKLLKEIDSR